MADLPPGRRAMKAESGGYAITGGDAFATLIENWQARRRQTAAIEAAAATAGTAGTPLPLLLPHHTLLLDTAKLFLQRDEYQMAVVIAQTAVEVLVDQIVSEQLKKRNTAPEVEKWIKERAQPFSLTNRYGQDLYVTLTKDKIQKHRFWKRYERHTKRRHDVVHGGVAVGKSLALESIAVVEEIIRHLEQRRGT